jgi:hypothetical protein
MSARDALLAKIQAQVEENSKFPPVVTLDEYFIGNETEDSIAPNQVGYGRPALAELYARFKEIQEKPSVQAALVGIHADWTEALKCPDVWPAGDHVHIYTTASAREIEAWIKGLAADVAIKGWPRGAHPSAPTPKPGYKVFSVCWD